jgi:alginate O-acetyltransferase complex protein AlgI
LPIGISFYTFQGVSYVIDVWRGEVEAEHNPILFGAYLSFFPQLIAGPIVRYKDVESDFHNPTLSTDMVAAGVSRFLLGLFKKVCIADVIAKVADAAFTTPVDNLTFATAWLGAIAYSIQIYFDFSGYSDMAIGLGSMFGIRFPENFNHPYAAATITEFWRRWHISLSSWFRDYLYIPLGGNRLGASRTYINLFIVFLATGIWHGAAWTFVLWGLWHGAFLMVERLVFQGRAAQIQWPTLRLLYLFPAVIFGWVLFRAPNIAHFCAYSLAMLKPFSNQAMVLTDAMLIVFSPTAILASLIAGCALIMQNQFPTLGSILSTNKTSVLRSALRLVLVVAACLICAAYVIPQDFSPFLYFRF